MKGIIVAKNSENSVLLLSDGTFKTVKTSEGYEVGMVLFVDNSLRPRSYYWRKIAYMAASILLVVFIGVGAFAWSTPAQFINIDINPSVELSVNYFDRIISVNALNADGQKLIESVSVRTQRYESGIELVICTAQEMGYLNDEEDVLISISSSDPKRTEKAQNDIREKVSPSVEILTFNAQERKQSVKKGISPGKNDIIEKVIEIGTDIDKEKLTEIPVKDLMKIVKQNRKTENAKKKEVKENNKDKKNNPVNSDKPGKGNENSDKPGKENENSDKPGKGNDNSDKPGKGNENSDKPGKGNGNSDNPGKGNDNSNKSGKGNDSVEKPGKKNENSDKPGKGNENSDKPGKGNDNSNKPGKGNDNSNKPGKGNENSDKPGKENDNSDKPGKGNDNSDNPGKGNDNSDKPGKGDKSTEKPGKGIGNSGKTGIGNGSK